MSLPVGAVDARHDPVPSLRGAVQRKVEPTVKKIDPVGVPPLPVTVATYETDVPAPAVLGILRPVADPTNDWSPGSGITSNDSVCVATCAVGVELSVACTWKL